MRYLLPLMLLLCLSSIAAAQCSKINGWVEQGGAVVQTQGQASTTKVQRSFPTATVTVYQTGTLTLVSLFSDNNCTVVKANPFTAGSDGSYGFYFTPIRIDLRFSGTGITTPFTISDVSAGGGGGTNTQGVVTLTAGIGNVGLSTVTANSKILVTGQDNNVTGAVRVSNLNPGVGFTLTSSNAADSGMVFWNASAVTGGGGGGGTPGGLSGQCQYNNAGAFGGVTNCISDGTTVTLTSPKVITNLKDTNANQWLGVTATASAVDSINITNAATANPATVKIGAVGTDNNINIEYDAKGTGTNLFPNGVSTGASPPAATFGTGGGAAFGEGTAATPLAGADIIYADSTAHALFGSWNGGTFYRLPQIIASGATAMGTSAISSGTCATVVTVAATGVLTTDRIVYGPNADPTGLTGYAPASTGSLYIWAYPTANNVNFKVCSNASGSLTPAALTLNWHVER